METKNKSAEFEEAIKSFSKMSLEVDTLMNSGNADAIKLMNKSIENRCEAIAHEASRRVASFEIEQKKVKSSESLQSHGALEKKFLEEVKQEFDQGVVDLKKFLRGDSALSVSKVGNDSGVKASEEKEKEESEEKEESDENEDTDENEDSDEDEDSDENEEDESSENESSDGENTDDDDDTTDKDSSDEEDEEDEHSTENENTDDENPGEDEAVPEKTDDSNKK